MEGHELEVFKGARETLQARRIKAIQFEYGCGNIDAMVLLKDILFLQPFGYFFFKIYPEGLRGSRDTISVWKTSNKKIGHSSKRVNLFPEPGESTVAVAPNDC